MDNQTKAKLTKGFIEAMPFCAALKMRVDEIGNGLAEISMPFSADLVGDPKRGIIHGGAVSALMDTCGGAAAICHPKAGESSATINLRIDYMRAARPGETVIASAHCYKVTRHVAFVRGVAHDGDQDDPVAMSQATFMTTSSEAHPMQKFMSGSAS